MNIKSKNKSLLQVGLITGNEGVDLLLTDALMYAKDIEINSIGVKKPNDSQPAFNVDVLIVYDRTVIKNKWILKKFSKQQEKMAQIYVATYKTRILGISELLESINGYILLDGDLMLLPNIIRMGRDGYSVMPANTFVDIGQGRELVQSLSLIECALLHELAIGHNEKTIARKMGTTSGEMASRLRFLFRKLNVPNLAEAASFAKRHKDDLHTTRRKLIRKEGMRVIK
jgi:DNA-binding NarL/FixJ family response regulator